MRARVRAGTSGWRRAAPRPPVTGAEAGYGGGGAAPEERETLGGSGSRRDRVLVLAYAAVSRRLLGAAITPAIVFVAGGIVASTDGLGWLDPTIWAHPSAGWPKRR